MGRKTFLAGVVVGAGAMYLLDPEHGPGRRVRLRQRLDRMRESLRSGALPSPLALIGRSGEIRHRAGDVDGMDVLHLRQGGADLGRLKASSALVGVAGGALAAFGLTRRGRVGGAMRAIGTTMLASGLRDLESEPRGLLRERRRSLEARRAIHIARPPHAVYEFWSEPANVARLIADVTEVRDLGDGEARWTANSAAGVPVSWIARITERHPDRLIAWRSEPDGAVELTATFRFTPAGSGTRVDARVVYTPPAGGREKAAAALVGDDPSTRLGAELERAKALIETGGGG